MVCPSQVKTMNVASTADALQLAEAVDCEGGGGSFVVEWMGRVTVEATISLFDGTSLEINSGTAGAVIEGNGECVLFNVTSAALSLSNISLEHGNGTMGGAIAGDYANVMCTNCSFIDNEASVTGGAISLARSNVSFAGQTVCRRNRAGLDGGCVGAMDGSLLAFAGKSTFAENVGSFGGAMYVRDSDVSFTGRSYLYDNKAIRKGGAVYAADTSLTFFGDGSSVAFVNNTAVQLFGGALSFQGQEALTINAESSLFENNRAPTGGAVFLVGRALNTVISAARFVSNSATLNGGGMVLSRTGAGIKDGINQANKLINCTFENNTAGRDGGAVVVAAGYVQINDTIFRGNIADEFGGAVVSDAGYSPGHLSLGGCELSYNRAMVGSAINMYIPSDDAKGSVEVHDVIFTGNDLLCGPTEFLAKTFNQQLAGQDLAYETACNSCANISLCDTCVVSDPNTVALCERLLEHTTSPDANGTLASLYLDEGYWRASNISRKILQCPHRKACRGGMAELCGGVFCEGGHCATGYTGPYCSVCEKGYTWGQGYTCVKCSGGSARTTEALGITALLVLVATLACAWQYLTSLAQPNAERSKLGWRGCMWRVYKAIPFEALRIIIVTWQIITEFSSVTNVSFPTYYEAFLSLVEVFNLDLTRMVSLGCYFETVGFYHRLLAITIVPLILGLLLLVTYWFARSRYWSDAQSMMEIRRRHLSVLILMTLLVYSSASSTVFQTFACDYLDDGRYYLRADYRLRCHYNKGSNHENVNNTVPLHRAYMIYAGLMIAVYPIGIPTMYGLLLWRTWRRSPRRGGPSLMHVSSMRPYHRGPEGNDRFGQREPTNRSSRVWLVERHRSLKRARAASVHPLPNRQDDTDDASNPHEYHESMLRGLWKPYKQDRLFYEVVECTRRVMLTGVVVFIYPDSAAQVSTTLLLALVFFALSEALDPYEDPQDCWVSRFGHLIVLLSMLVALITRVDPSEEPGAYGVILVVANVLMLMAVLGESVFPFYSFTTTSVDGESDSDD